LQKRTIDYIHICARLYCYICYSVCEYLS